MRAPAYMIDTIGDFPAIPIDPSWIPPGTEVPSWVPPGIFPTPPAPAPAPAPYVPERAWFTEPIVLAAAIAAVGAIVLITLAPTKGARPALRFKASDWTETAAQKRARQRRRAGRYRGN